MENINLWKQIIHPILGMAILTLFSAYPIKTQAQLPTVGDDTPGSTGTPQQQPNPTPPPAAAPDLLQVAPPPPPVTPLDLNRLRQQYPNLDLRPRSPATLPSGAYRLGSGDLLQIEILEVPELNKEIPVLSGGTVNLPLIGPVSVQGLTLPQAANIISTAYLEVLKERPTVTVTVITPRPFRFGIAGEVLRPGFYTIPLTPGVGVKPAVLYPTITQAIERAGGITQAADIRQIQIRRSSETPGTQQTINVNLWDLLQGGDFTQDIVLQDGDGIYVPSTISPNLAEARRIANTSFAPPPDQPRNIIVVGEVNRPGSYVLVGGNTTSEIRTVGLPTVSRAIQLAGGITQKADLRRIQLRRPTASGAQQLFNINLWQLLQTGDLTQDAVISEGDTIIIPTATEINPAEAYDIASANFSPETIKVYITGEVRVGGAGTVLQLPSNATLNQALFSGAFGYENLRAERDFVQLVRLNPDGTAQARTIQVDLSQGINEQTNPLLRNNDIIVVARNDPTQNSDRLQNVVRPVVEVFPFFNFLGILRSLFGL